MKRSLLVLMLFGLACAQGPSKSSTQSASVSEMRTIDNVTPQPQVLQPPPMVTDEGPAPKPKANVVQADAPPPPTEADEQFRAQLPFAPAIAMDPVDGSKISMRVDTPQVEFKNHIYYFSSEDNKRLFTSNPEQFTKGLFSHL